MITLVIKNKMFSIKGNSTVKDENDVDRFVVKGKLISWRKKKRIYDMEGNLLYTVKNKLIKWWMNSCYVCDKDGHKIARIKQKFKLFKKEFTLTGYADEIEIKGDFIQHCLEIYKNGIRPTGTKDTPIDTRTFAYSCKMKDSSLGQNGYGCTAWVIYNKNMDYLKCRDELSWDGKHSCD